VPPADVTICIPAWQAEGFIGRTLSCAAAQSHARIRVLVSIDYCEDRSESICRELALQDRRIDVVVQKERLGWSRNANCLLDRVDTEFYFLYFHDDIIEPEYTALLRQALLEAPEAKSAHCDLERFGNVNSIDPGCDYRGTDSQRLANLLVGPVRGAPLRSLTRSELLGQGLRFPEIGGDGFWRCIPFLLQLLAAGPALHVPQVLYRRWFRDGSLTTTWAPKTVDALLEGQRQSVRLCLDIIARTEASEAEKELVRFCLYVFMMTYTRRNELPLRDPQLIAPAAVSAAFADTRIPPSDGELGAEVRQWIHRAHAELLVLEAEHALLHGNHGAAKLRLAAAVGLDPRLCKKRVPGLLARMGVPSSAFALPSSG